MEERVWWKLRLDIKHGHIDRSLPNILQSGQGGFKGGNDLNLRNVCALECKKLLCKTVLFVISKRHQGQSGPAHHQGRLEREKDREPGFGSLSFRL